MPPKEESIASGCENIVFILREYEEDYEALKRFYWIVPILYINCLFLGGDVDVCSKWDRRLKSEVELYFLQKEVLFFSPLNRNFQILW